MRWATSFSFGFDADMPPVSVAHRIELFALDDSPVVAFEDLEAVFEDGFESGTTDRWDVVTR